MVLFARVYGWSESDSPNLTIETLVCGVRKKETTGGRECSEVPPAYYDRTTYTEATNGPNERDLPLSVRSSCPELRLFAHVYGSFDSDGADFDLRSAEKKLPERGAVQECLLHTTAKKATKGPNEGDLPLSVRPSCPTFGLLELWNTKRVKTLVSQKYDMPDRCPEIPVSSN